jgi:hypothetical protein
MILDAAKLIQGCCVTHRIALIGLFVAIIPMLIPLCEGRAWNGLGPFPFGPVYPPENYSGPRPAPQITVESWGAASVVVPFQVRVIEFQPELMSFVSDVLERGWLRRLIVLCRSPHLVLPLGLLLVGLAFGLNIERGLALKLDRTAPTWVADAMPPALSCILFHHDKRYTTLTAVHEAFYQGSTAPPRTAPAIDAAIAAVAAIHDRIDRSYALLGSDDKGIVDFVEGAFRIFGLRTSSVFKGYFLVLGLSCVAYLLAYGTRPAPVLALTFSSDQNTALRGPHVDFGLRLVFSRQQRFPTKALLHPCAC